MEILDKLGTAIINKYLFELEDEQAAKIVYENRDLFFDNKVIDHLEDLKILQTDYHCIDVLDCKINMIELIKKRYFLEPVLRELISTRLKLHYPTDITKLIESAKQILKLSDPNNQFSKKYYGYNYDFEIDLNQVRLQLANDLKEANGTFLAEDLEEALFLCEGMAEKLAETSEIEEKSDILRSLSVIYSMRLKGNKISNLQLADKYAKEALTLITDTNKGYAQCHNNLATVYNQFALHGIEKEYFVKKAISHCEEALEHLDNNDILFHGLVCMNLNQFHNLLGYYYFEHRFKQLSIETLDAGLNYGHSALKLLEKAEHPFWIAVAKTTIGQTHEIAYQKLELDFYEDAIEMFKQSLSTFTKSDYPQMWASVHHSLGMAYYFNRDEDVEKFTNQALEEYNKSLMVFTKNETPQNWASVQHSIGSTNYFLFKRLKGRNYFNKAVYAFEHALEIYTPELFPNDFIEISHELAEAYYFHRLNNKDIEKTYGYLILAHKAIENLRAQSSTQNAKFNIAWDYMRIYKLIVQVCLLLGKIDEAFTFACVSKGRSLVDKKYTSEANFKQIIDSDDEIKMGWNKLSEIRIEIAELEAQINKMMTTNSTYPEKVQELSNELKEKRNYLRRFIDLMNVYYPQLSSVISSPALETDKLLKFCNSFGDIGIIDFYYHYGGLGAFVFCKGKLTYISLEGKHNGLYEEIADMLADGEAHFIKMYYKSEEEINALFGRFYEKLIEPMIPYLSNVRTLLISPMGDLHKIPFALAFNAKTRRYLIDEFKITMAPGISFLHAILHNKPGNFKPTQRFSNIFSIITTAEETLYPLEHARTEEENIKKLFKGFNVSLFDSDAIAALVIQNSKENVFSTIHFSCHGSFDSEHPEFSGLYLYQNQLLTTEQIQTEMKFSGFPFVTLAACQTGINKYNPGDQATGLNVSILSAGARSTLSSLWSIEDSSSRHFYQTFYKECIENGLSESDALRSAMIKTRESDENWGWSHPFYWAAFQLTGIPDPLFTN